MKLNLNRFNKNEILWLWKHRCRHKHSYLEHLSCFIEEKPLDSPVKEKIGHLDIESGLNANFEYVISYCILDHDSDKIYGRVLTSKEVKKWDLLDKNLMYEFCNDVRKFDRLVVYWGKDRRHDLPFLRSRCIKARADFPLYREIFVTDLYDICKNKLKLDHYGLGNVCSFLNIPSKQHPINPEIWLRAKMGHVSSLKYIWLHNLEDVISLKKVYLVMEKYSKSSKISI